MTINIYKYTFQQQQVVKKCIRSEIHTIIVHFSFVFDRNIFDRDMTFHRFDRQLSSIYSYPHSEALCARCKHRKILVTCQREKSVSEIVYIAFRCVQPLLIYKNYHKYQNLEILILCNQFNFNSVGCINIFCHFC